MTLAEKRGQDWQHAHIWYPRGESNAYRRNRNPKFYPLNYGGISSRTNRKDCKFSNIFSRTACFGSKVYFASTPLSQEYASATS